MAKTSPSKETKITKSSAAKIKVDILSEISAATKALLPAVNRLKKTLTNLDPAKVPIGALSDLLYDLRQLAKLPKSLATPFDDVLDPVLKAVEEQFIQTLSVGESSGAQGFHSRTQITESVVPTLEDKPKFYAYVKKHGAFELLNQSLNRNAIQERWDNKKQIPGIGKYHVKKVSCTKLSGK